MEIKVGHSPKVIKSDVPELERREKTGCLGTAAHQKW